MHNGEARERYGQKEAVPVFLDAFDPLTNELLVLIAAGDLAAAHQHWVATNVGEFAGVPVTGRSVAFVSTATLWILTARLPRPSTSSA